MSCVCYHRRPGGGDDLGRLRHKLDRLVSVEETALARIRHLETELTRCRGSQQVSSPQRVLVGLVVWLTEARQGVGLAQVNDGSPRGAVSTGRLMECGERHHEANLISWFVIVPVVSAPSCTPAFLYACGIVV